MSTPCTIQSPSKGTPHTKKMPAHLRRGLTAILRGKKAGSSVSVAIESTDSPRHQSNGFLDILEEEQVEDDKELQRAVIQSLQAALEEERDASVARLREKDQQMKRVQQTVTQLSVKNDQLLGVAMSAQELLETNRELKEQLKEYQVSLARMVETQAQTQKELDSIRDREQGPHTVAEESHQATNPSSSQSITEEEKSNNSKQIKLLETNLESALAYAEELTKQLANERRLHQEELMQVKASHPYPISTPKQLIAYKNLRDRLKTKTRVEAGGNERVKEITSFTQITRDLLDAELSQEQVTMFRDELDQSTFDLTTELCSSCGLLKVFSRDTPISEFRTWSRTLSAHNSITCGVWICKECYLAGIIQSIEEDYWAVDLRESGWIKCPAEVCNNSVLNIRNKADFRRLLDTLNDPNIVYHLNRYDHLRSLRQRMVESWDDHSPNDDEADLTTQLHRQLIQKGVMFSLLDGEEVPGVELVSRPSDIRMIEIERAGRTVRIPLATALFQQQTGPKECVFCAEEFSEIDVVSLEKWQDACCGFEGDWVWEVFNFPVKLGQSCAHSVSFCTGCFDRHVKARLEEDGRAGCDKIACPLPDCGRLLTYDEIRLYAEESTFTTYDQYLNLNALSQVTNFRWCLGPGCKNGQLYDLEDNRDLPRGGPMIECEECDFAMCYTHCVPWHKGQTCKQYSSEHNDPNTQLSRNWIDENTKNCPSCNVPINKGDQCFHMTCNCGHEFCWLCLADWDLIRPNAGAYNQQAHAEGCYFRTSDLRPTQLTGTTLNEALELRRRRS